MHALSVRLALLSKTAEPDKSAHEPSLRPQTAPLSDSERIVTDQQRHAARNQIKNTTLN